MPMPVQRMARSRGTRASRKIFVSMPSRSFRRVDRSMSVTPTKSEQVDSTTRRISSTAVLNQLFSKSLLPIDFPFFG